MIQIVNELGDQPATRMPQRWLRKIAIGHLAKHLRFHSAEKRSIEREQGNGNAMELFPIPQIPQTMPRKMS